IRSIFNKYNGSLATTGSVDFLFERKGVFVLEIGKTKKEEIELDLIDGGAEELDYDPDTNELEIVVAFEDFGNMQDTLEQLDLEPRSANLERIPTVYTKLELDDARKVLKLIENLEERSEEHTSELQSRE